MAKAWGILVAVVAAAGLLTPAPAFAQASDAAVKAAFLPRFARYVTWPPSAAPKPGEPFVLCVIGGDPFGSQIDAAARGQAIDGRRIVVKRMESGNGDGCHIAFIQGSKTQPAGQLLAAVGRKPVLTVTDAANGGQRGIIHFANVGGRVRFFIDEGSASQRRMSISSRLLALAVGVKR